MAPALSVKAGRRGAVDGVGGRPEGQGGAGSDVGPRRAGRGGRGVAIAAGAIPSDGRFTDLTGRTSFTANERLDGSHGRVPVQARADSVNDPRSARGVMASTKCLGIDGQGVRPSASHGVGTRPTVSTSGTGPAPGRPVLLGRTTPGVRSLGRAGGRFRCRVGGPREGPGTDCPRTERGVTPAVP